MKLFVLPIYTLALREIVRFYRQKSRVIGAIVPPLIFWILIGSGLGGTLQKINSMELSYTQYFFPGTVMMVVLFSSIFSTISIIEDRKEGFLQSVLVSPVPRLSIVLGKILGGSVISIFQGLIFVILAPLLSISFQFTNLLFSCSVLVFSSIGLTGLGFILAWQMDSTQGFHSIMNLFLMPMWFLSGAIFPLEGTPFWLRSAMTLNPLTYGVSALRYGFYGPSLSKLQFFPSPFLCLAVTCSFTVLMIFISAFICQRPLKQ